jgi:hypothetical protein
VKVLARKGATIVYAKKLREPDGRRRQLVDYLPPDRNALIIWRDQFGTIHGVGFGDVETEPSYPDESIDEFVTRALERL